MSTPDPQPVNEPVEWPLAIRATLRDGEASAAALKVIAEAREKGTATSTREEMVEIICSAFDEHAGHLLPDRIHLATPGGDYVFWSTTDARRTLLPLNPPGFVRDGGHLGRALRRTRHFREEATVTSPTITDLLGEEPDGYRDGGYVDRLTRLDAILGARKRLQEYVEARDAFYGDEALDENVIDYAGTPADTPRLLMSDLRLLAGVEPPEIEE